MGAQVKVVVFLGAPGSGKGTQAKTLVAKHKNWRHISTGDLFRAEIASGSELGASLQSILAAGQLVTDDLTNNVFQSQVKKILNDAPATEVLLLDGYPRTGPQAEALVSFCESEGRLQKPIVIELLVDEEALVERLSGRLINPRTGRIYHKVAQPPKRDGVCDEDGGPLIQREDDKPEVIRSRFKIYMGQRDAIVQGLKKAAPTPFQVNAAGSPSEITAQLEKIILGL